VPGTIPGILGVAAFGGIKFVGYSLAISGLKKFEPNISSSATKIAAVRTGLGLLLGPLATILVLYLISLIGFLLLHPVPSSGAGNSGPPMLAIYLILFIVRVFVWAFVLFLFTRRSLLSRSSFWLYAFLGAVISSLLDWPGYALAIAAPGQIVFC
jgi:hypothetical protein